MNQHEKIAQTQKQKIKAGKANWLYHVYEISIRELYEKCESRILTQIPFDQLRSICETKKNPGKSQSTQIEARAWEHITIMVDTGNLPHKHNMFGHLDFCPTFIFNALPNIARNCSILRRVSRHSTQICSLPVNHMCNWRYLNIHTKQQWRAKRDGAGGRRLAAWMPPNYD